MTATAKALGIWFFRLKRTQTQLRTMIGIEKMDLGRHGSDVQGVQNNGPGREVPARA